MQECPLTTKCALRLAMVSMLALAGAIGCAEPIGSSPRLAVRSSTAFAVQDVKIDHFEADVELRHYSTATNPIAPVSDARVHIQRDLVPDSGWTSRIDYSTSGAARVGAAAPNRKVAGTVIRSGAGMHVLDEKGRVLAPSAPPVEKFGIPGAADARTKVNRLFGRPSGRVGRPGAPDTSRTWLSRYRMSGQPEHVAARRAEMDRNYQRSVLTESRAKYRRPDVGGEVEVDFDDARGLIVATRHREGGRVKAERQLTWSTAPDGSFVLSSERTATARPGHAEPTEISEAIYRNVKVSSKGKGR